MTLIILSAIFTLPGSTSERELDIICPIYSNDKDLSLDLFGPNTSPASSADAGSTLCITVSAKNSCNNTIVVGGVFQQISICIFDHRKDYKDNFDFRQFSESPRSTSCAADNSVLTHGETLLIDRSQCLINMTGKIYVRATLRFSGGKSGQWSGLAFGRAQVFASVPSTSPLVSAIERFSSLLSKGEDIEVSDLATLMRRCPSYVGDALLDRFPRYPAPARQRVLQAADKAIDHGNGYRLLYRIYQDWQKGVFHGAEEDMALAMLSRATKGEIAVDEWTYRYRFKEEIANTIRPFLPPEEE